MNEDLKRIIKWLVVAAVIIGSFLLIIFTNQNPIKAPPKITDTDWIKGNKDAGVELIEYSDFECPACAVRIPILDKIIKEFGNHIKLAYRHLPLKNIHANAALAAQAAEAAGLQGKFWEMHDKLFYNQNDWKDLFQSGLEKKFTNYAAELGLNIEKFAADLNSHNAKKAIDEDIESAISIGLDSTPTFFLNGELIDPRNYEDFRTFIRKAVQN